MMILNKPIRIATISDIHLGSKSNKTSKIIKNLRKCIFEDPFNRELDILFLAGDVFDRLLDLNSEVISLIDYWIKDLLIYCSTNKIKLRILEGTPSHDWNQSERFITIQNILNIPTLDIKYIKDVEIEIMEDLNLSVLYVPDEIQETAEKTLKLVKTRLKENNLDAVDIGVMHGQFEYQLPAHIKNIPRHNSSDYLEIVRKVIFIGHIHTHSTFDRIIAQGSFDRLTHGQEEKKGYVRVELYDDNYEMFFIENKNARIYKTIDCTGLTIEDSFIRIRQQLPEEEDSCVRIIMEKANPLSTNMTLVADKFPGIYWSKLIKEEKQNNEDMVLFSEEETKYTPITINKDNLVDLILPRLQLKLDNDNFLLNRSRTMIEETL
jgi:DNA repair exonuclease SbcCD nuclease subunit